MNAHRGAGRHIDRLLLLEESFRQTAVFDEAARCRVPRRSVVRVLVSTIVADLVSSDGIHVQVAHGDGFPDLLHARLRRRTDAIRVILHEHPDSQVGQWLARPLRYCQLLGIREFLRGNLTILEQLECLLLHPFRVIARPRLHHEAHA